MARAIDSVLAQTRRVDEIVVVDDGSTDGTEAMLRERYGGRIRYVYQPNAGVSAARNHGMAIAQGRYFALLESEDEWLPEKTARQVEWMQAHPDFGMVLCDVERVDDEHRPVDIMRRRDVIHEDGWILRWILHNPSFVPASALLKREVVADVGGFDVTLRTAEDIEFHLRVAHCWKIGVVELPLVRAMRGHEGLSAEAGTYDDYVHVVERAVANASGKVDEIELRRALSATYARNARGMLMSRRWSDGWRLAHQAWRITPDTAQRLELLRLAPFALRRGIRSLLP